MERIIGADERLKLFAQNRLSKLDVVEPYVWRLRLSNSEFSQLEQDLTDSVASHNGSHSHLLSDGNALISIVYLAEWYKRKYTSNTTPKAVNFDSEELKTIWQNSGINQNKFVYSSADGSRLWQYSAYVLGGLAVKHELGKNDKGRFLKALCRIYHGEEYTLENLDEANRAIAFKESIRNKQSLFFFLKEILNGSMPFAEEEISNPAAEVNLFIQRIKTANDDVLKIKFRPEWVIRYSPEYASMSRSLRLWMKPEDLDGDNHEYLRFDRVHLWGVPYPEKQQHLKLGVEFIDNGEVISEANFDSPLVTYVNTGDPLTGFIAWGVNDYAKCKSIPSKSFTKINVVVKDDDDNKYIAQSIDTSDLLQVWRSDPYGDEWVSTTNAQKETAVVFSSKWDIHLKSTSEIVEKKPFRDKKFGDSDKWGWYYIVDNVTLSNEDGREYTLFNRVGYDQITTKLYLNTIRYAGGGKIKHWFVDDPDLTDELESELLPLVFAKDDIIVQHFNTKDDILNAEPDSDTAADKIEFLVGTRYQEWCSSCEPPYGKCHLRVTIKGRMFPFDVCYLPSASDENPVIRDFAETSVVYAVSNALGQVEIKKFKDEIVWNGTPLEPVKAFHVGTDDDYVELEVYRPVLEKGAVLAGHVFRVLEEGENITIPYILKKQFALQDFSRNGYREYKGDQLNTIFTSPYINIQGNPNSGVAALASWSRNNTYKATLLDSLAPDYLFVVFGSSKEVSPVENAEYYYWSYNKDEEPILINQNEIENYKKRWGIIFQGMDSANDETCMKPIENWDIWDCDYNIVSIVKCFEIATKYNIYFFAIQHLRELGRNEYVPKLFVPLQLERNGKLSDLDIEGLNRFQEEFNFRWDELGVQYND